ncbi:Invasion associated locus B family protein [Thioalkalivibrio nitratireducens DSM 14787]|uniref:Invasion associated locus B family protein n=1 Tax=Thioalkalivibrio nitratireducens (strain DSM 14787 / UNIQEM 213 / ALEN2) TaxID=1255043 RepID=L0DVH2_THIND|nr:invasion associated locus B family protein [Thioalkalivibrio nitratireducens]AGA33007.1 Invasion associated locus B family protein [Thioalkalivibrio nitratireducens DSM 14787]
MLTIAALVAAPLAATAQLDGPVRPGPTHQDWQVLCEDGPAGENCFITQTTVDEDDEPVMQVSVGILEGSPAIVIHLPLGLDLRPGVLFEIENQVQREFPYQTCLPNGCRVLAPIDDEMLQAMRAGVTFRVGVVPVGAERIGVVEGSLMGFTAGFRAISE